MPHNTKSVNMARWMEGKSFLLLFFWCIGWRGECAWSFSKSPHICVCALSHAQIYTHLSSMHAGCLKMLFLMAHKKRFFGAVVDILNENPISCNLSREITLRHPHTQPSSLGPVSLLPLLHFFFSPPPSSTHFDCAWSGGCWNVIYGTPGSLLCWSAAWVRIERVLMAFTPNNI